MWPASADEIVVAYGLDSWKPTLGTRAAGPEIRSYMTMAAVKDVSAVDAPVPAAIDESGRSSQTFLVKVVARRGSALRRAVARGRDIYAVTAPLVVEATKRIVGGLVKTPGVVTAGQAFDARDFLRALCPEHLTLEFDDGARLPGSWRSG
jgi:hypothetical protein